MLGDLAAGAKLAGGCFANDAGAAVGLERESEALTGLGGSGAGQHDDGAGKARAGDFGEGPVFLGEAAYWRVVQWICSGKR